MLFQGQKLHTNIVQMDGSFQITAWVDKYRGLIDRVEVLPEAINEVRAMSDRYKSC
jgi:hypothetical protein